LSVDGSPTQDAGDLQRIMGAESVGQILHLSVLRGDRVIDVEVVPSELE
jgi:hypothetical protein